jgi:hypothetical protein
MFYDTYSRFYSRVQHTVVNVQSTYTRTYIKDIFFNWLKSILYEFESSTNSQSAQNEGQPAGTLTRLWSELKSIRTGGLTHSLTPAEKALNSFLQPTSPPKYQNLAICFGEFVLETCFYISPFIQNGWLIKKHFLYGNCNL